MIINKDIFLLLVKKHKKHLNETDLIPYFNTIRGDCTNVQDCLLMYLLILENRCKFVVEFSPMLGYSTRYIARAMKILGHDNSMFTVEKNTKYASTCKARLESLELSNYCDVVMGDAISRTKKLIEVRGWEGKVDFIFIDSDHSKQFANIYINEIFPLLAPHCIVVVHDICGINSQTTLHSLDFKSSLNSTSDQFSEYKSIKNYIETNKLLHTLTHPLFGGHWGKCSWRINLKDKESSPNLPHNRELYNSFEEIVGYNLLNHNNFQHPNALLFRLPQ